MMAFTALAAAGPAGAQETVERPLSLSQAVQEALARNPDLRIAASRVDMTRANERSALSPLIPQLDVGAGFVRSNDPVFAFGTKLRQGAFAENDFSLDALNNPTPINDWTATAQLRWSVLDPVLWAGKGAAGQRSEASAWERERTEEATIFRTKALYYGVLAAEEGLRTARAGERAASATLERFQARHDRGLLTLAELRQAEAELLASTARRIDATRRRDESRELLALQLGWAAGTVPVPTDTLPEAVPLSTPGFDPAARSDVRMLAALEAEASAEKKRSDMTLLPALDAFAGFSSHASEAFRSDGTNWSVGFLVRWNLFSGLGRLASRDQAAAAKAIAETRYEHSLREAPSEAARARQAVEAALETVTAMQAAAAAATEGQTLMRRRFEEGLATPADLLQAEARATDMEARAVDALALYHIATARLEFTTSQSIPHDIEASQ